MNIVFRIMSIAVMCAVICVLLRDRAGPVSLLLTMAVCTGALLAVLQFVSPVLQLISRLRRLSGLSDPLTAPLLKVTGIGLLTQIASGLCEDAGEKSLAKTVEISGSFFAVYISLPLMTAVIDMLERVLGG